MRRFLSALFLAVLVIGGIMPSQTFAANGAAGGITISPLHVNETVEPGGAFKGVLQIKNDTGYEQQLYFLSRDIKTLTEDGQVIIRDKDEPKTGYELSGWITPEGAGGPYVLGKGASRDIGYTVTIPKDASPGSYFGLVALGTQPKANVETNGSSVGYNLFSIITVRVPGNAKIDGMVTEFSSSKWIYGNLPASFSLRFKDTGNVVLRPQGVIDVTDMFGKKKVSLPFNQTLAGILPGQTRVYLTEWPKYDGFLFGRYTAKLGLSYGDTTTRSEMVSTSFWILPFWFTLTLLSCIAALVIMMRMYIRMSVTKQVGRVKGTQQSGTHLITGSVIVLLVVFVMILVVYFL